ncbi:MAG: uroporphyrinogen-III synthase [Gemmatimonadota bacterium]|nr:MAG: uroporphyrinogen-III synthase [Gemmatimonadota bacterium]
MSDRPGGTPLRGKRIAVTRPAGQAASLIDGLRALGAEAVDFPTIRIADPAESGPLRRAIERLAEYDWIVFTSANGVARFWQELRALRDTSQLPSHIAVAAIGPATAAAVEERGARPRLVPEEYVAEAVAEALREVQELAGRRVLLPRAAGARRVLPDRLRAAGAEVDEVVAYESLPDMEGIASLRAALARGELDMVTFTAASTVRHYVDRAGADMGRASVAAIGPITADAARAAGVRVDVVAETYTVSGLVTAICDYFAEEEVGA